MRIGFAGTPAFAAQHLQALADFVQHKPEHALVAVFSQPDRAAGRGRRLTPSPVSECAKTLGLPLLNPLSFRADREGGQQAQQALQDLHLDLLVVVAYGLILPPAVLTLPRWGCINVHASLLPRWRGAAPIQRAIEAGDTQTGVCIMQMEAGLDTGPVWTRASIAIDPQETGSELQTRLAALGSQQLVAFLGSGRLQTGAPEPQPDEGVTYAHKLSSQDREVRFDRPVQAVVDQIRALETSPGAVSQLRGEAVKLGGACVVERLGQWGPPGSILSMGAPETGIVVACSQGALGLTWLQRPGGKPQPGVIFSRALGLKPNEQFGVSR
jgi:methionyl-tRNA formyltransferase